MRETCTRWVALSDRQALAEPLRDEERAFLLEHAASCAACSREQAAWDDLSTLIDPAKEPAPPVRVHKTRPVVYALLACAAGLALAFFPRAAEQAPPPGFSAHVIDALEVDGKPAAQGESVAVGAKVLARERGCLVVEPGVRVCLSAGSLMRVSELGAQRRRLELLEGKLAAELDPQPAGSSFGVDTRDGSAIAIGTAFSVEVPAQGVVITRVMHGTVLVRSQTGHEQKLTAHRMAPMVGEARALPAAEEAAERSLVTSSPQPAEPAKVAAPEPAMVEPLPTLPPAKPSARPTPAPTVTPRVAPAEPFAAEEPTAEVAPPAGVAPPADIAPPAQVEPTATQFLLAARECRARGDVAGALAAYRALFALDANSAEARTALVPYGELLLSQGHAREAVGAFEHYLEQPGALSEEAAFGRVRALRVLGARESERQAVARFLDSYPTSPLADGLRLRARELGARP